MSLRRRGVAVSGMAVARVCAGVTVASMSVPGMAGVSAGSVPM